MWLVSDIFVFGFGIKQKNPNALHVVLSQVVGALGSPETLMKRHHMKNRPTEDEGGSYIFSRHFSV